MNHWRCVAGPLALGLLLLTTGGVRADRVPSHKTVIPRDPGARGDITVPYTTNGFTTLGVYQGVAPRIYSTPIVDDLAQPQDRPVFNLIFYGATQAFGAGNEGAVSRPKQRVPH